PTTTTRARGLCPRAFPAKRRPQSRAKAQLSLGSLAQVRPWVRVEDQRLARLLLEVEVADEGAEDRLVLANLGTRVGTPVRRRVQPLAAEEVVLDELRIGVEAERLMVDEATARIGADHEPRHAQPVAEPVDVRRHDVVIE